MLVLSSGAFAILKTYKSQLNGAAKTSGSGEVTDIPSILSNAVVSDERLGFIVFCKGRHRVKLPFELKDVRCPSRSRNPDSLI